MRPDDLRALWLSVLLQAVRDALSRDWHEKTDRRLARIEAQAWFDAAGPDFRETCYLAGIEPDVVADWWKVRRHDGIS